VTKQFWLVAARNTKTGQITFFHDWADNPDSVLKQILDNFFDIKVEKKLKLIEEPYSEYDLGIEESFQDTRFRIEREDSLPNTIPFPSINMEILRIPPVETLEECRTREKEILKEFS